ncbi:MAG: hypothetical protein ABH950_00935 [Candidatus Altiarchaeota archaeon]
MSLSREFIHEVIKECLLVVEGVAKEGRITVSNQCATDLPRISVDTMRMKQVLINLLIITKMMKSMIFRRRWIRATKNSLK